MDQPSRLKAVGYWHSELESNELFPDPRLLVDASWCVSERARVQDYLRAGRTSVSWRGLSHCRFSCDASVREMGSRCLTDGAWIWPEGLVHYVEAHHVRLPDEFLDWMRTRDWHVAEDATPLDQGKSDPALWIGWGRTHAPRK